MLLKTGSKVTHPDYGDGVIVQLLGHSARVDFFGDHIDVDTEQLHAIEEAGANVVTDISVALTRQRYFTSVEAINLGVVPPDPDQLLHFTMNGESLKGEIAEALAEAPTSGLSKVVVGHYGTGKTHYLQLAKAVALKSGWVVSFVEFDPKAADPAKPHLVYRHIMSSLEFPAREDGSVARGFLGLVKEIRKHWQRAELRKLPFFRNNPWFWEGLAVILANGHDEENEEYVAACSWLAGDRQLPSMRALARYAHVSHKVPPMPASRETAEIYAFHLVVVNELLRKMGYKGLLMILDEAEHVRGYNVTRRERANHFFDYLARCAHAPAALDDAPALNEHGYTLPEFWREGPHFGLYTGLTSFGGSSPVFRDLERMPYYGIPRTREECVFIHSPEDVILTRTPGPQDFGAWSEKLLAMFHEYCPEDAELFADRQRRGRIAQSMSEIYARLGSTSAPLRNWIKLGGLACSVPLVDRNCSERELIERLAACGEQAISL